ncbi:MAG: tetratricopeptide repeat protein [Defluviicoccus sp.]|nr:tetratricopeptide repeat protein [Defluviicoccus sp.]MDE0385119.1 tetratricopeptide repeat protein [Defluviicoccus sp.]
MAEHAGLARAAALHRDGRLADAVAAYRALLADDPENAGIWHNMGVALAGTGDAEAALAAFDRALALRPDYLHARVNRGGALQSLGRHAAAAAAYAAALERDPGLYEVRLREGLMRLAAGDRRGAMAAFRKTRAVRRDPAAMGGDHPSFTRSSRLKLAHDAAQLRLLADAGREGADFAALAALYERAVAELPAGAGSAPLPEELAGTHNRALHTAEADEIPGGALDRSLDGAEIETRYRERQPGIAVVDRLLSRPALAALRRHLLESTIWHDGEHIPGFLAAYLEDGLASPLLLQIADELRAALPAILAPHPLYQAWAFKCLTGSQGIDIHADSGAVSVNFWLTPDAANLEPDAGGLTVHRAPPPESWKIADYKRDKERIRALLKASDAGALTIPYAANRAVLFRSDLFHESGRVRFRPGYANHRINITLLFGERR